MLSSRLIPTSLSEIPTHICASHSEPSLMLYILWLALFTFYSPVSCLIPHNVYQDLSHYCHYAKLSGCISKNRLFEKPMSEGGCDLEFCQSKEATNITIAKIYEAPFIEIGTGYISVDDLNEEVVIAFRGSSSTAEWISDFTIFSVDYEPISKVKAGVPSCKGCKVHMGFYQNLGPIVDKYLKFVELIYKKHPKYRLVLVGHSLGGALATLLGIEFRVKGFEPLIYSYGSPKIFNDEMAQWVNTIFKSEKLIEKINEKGQSPRSGLVRIIHENDYVPMLPPYFKTAGVEFYIQKRDLPHFKEDIDLLSLPEAQTFSTNVSGIPEGLDLLNAYEHRSYFITINTCEDVN